jgi:hypothetical protein
MRVGKETADHLVEILKEKIDLKVGAYTESA